MAHPQIVYTYRLYFSGRPKGSSADVPFQAEAFDILADHDEKARAAARGILKNWVFELDGLQLRAPEFRRSEWIPLIGQVYGGGYGYDT